MSLVTCLQCVECDRAFPEGQHMTCPDCGDRGILDVKYNFDQPARPLTRDALGNRPLSIWRYLELLPVDTAPPALAHVGWTPLIEAPRLAEALGVGRVRLKDDGRSASGSFKERASAVGVTRALAEGIADIACSSTGNAATSMAHCAAAIGMRSRIFVGRGVPEAKLAQMLAYGATVYQVDGAYNDAYMLCQKACKEFGWYDRNCALNPYLIEGKKTAGLEIAEQCADDPPDWVSISVGDGCSIAGVHKGMAEMKTLRIIGWSARMLGTQAAGVAPITALFEKTSTLDKYQASDTYADSINVPVPRNSRKALNAVRDSGGALVAVSDQQMMDAVAVCGRLSGVFAEPAAGAAIAGVAEARRRGILDSHSNVVILVTGNGLKDTRGALAAVGKPHAIPADLRAVEAIEKQLSSAAGAAR